ncbi:MAG: hypothetical protein IJY65_02415 [Clostridia bacterium]|nr:hypothetical protein [Clostridia bacterium]
MTTQLKKFKPRLLLILSASNLACFLITILTFLYSEGDAAIYIAKFTTDLLLSLEISVGATAVLLVLNMKDKRDFILTGLLLSLSELFYALPYNFIYYEYNGYDTYESLGLTAILSPLQYLIHAAAILILALVITIVYRLVKHKRGAELDIRASAALGSPFDFENEATLSIFFISLGVFIYNMTLEIIDTVTYLIDYAGSYRQGEIIYIVCRFLFHFAALFAYQTVAFYSQRLIVKRDCDTST